MIRQPTEPHEALPILLSQPCPGIILPHSGPLRIVPLSWQCRVRVDKRAPPPSSCLAPSSPVALTCVEGSQDLTLTTSGSLSPVPPRAWHRHLIPLHQHLLSALPTPPGAHHAFPPPCRNRLRRVGSSSRQGQPSTGATEDLLGFVRPQERRLARVSNERPGRRRECAAAQGCLESRLRLAEEARMGPRRCRGAHPRVRTLPDPGQQAELQAR